MMKQIKQVMREVTLKRLRFSRSQWFTILGGSVLFISWLVDRNFQSEFTQEKEFLKRSQLVIDITEVQRSIWEQQYLKELRQRPTDSLLIAIAQTNLSETYSNLLNWSEDRLKRGNDSLVIQNTSKKIYTDSISRQALKTGHYSVIAENFREVVGRFSTQYKSLDRSFIIRVGEIDKKESFSSTVFTLLYGIGSIFLGLGYIYRIYEIDGKKDNNKQFEG